MEQEIWKDIPRYEGYYMASNLGRIKSIKRQGSPGNIRKPRLQHKGYLKLNLNKNGNGKMEFVARLIAKTFIPNPENYNQVNHINGIKIDNRAHNLEWCNNSQNRLHAFKIGLINKPVGELNSNAKLTRKEVNEIRSFHKRYSLQELSKMYNISTQQIRNIVLNKSWKHIA